MKKITKTNPIIKDVIPDFIESSPNQVLQFFPLQRLEELEAPDLNNKAKSVAS